MTYGSRNSHADDHRALMPPHSRSHLDDDVESIRRASSGLAYEMADDERAGVSSAPSTPVGRWAAAAASVRRGEYSDERSRAAEQYPGDADNLYNMLGEGYADRMPGRAPGYAAGAQLPPARDASGRAQARLAAAELPGGARGSYSALDTLDPRVVCNDDVPATARPDRSQAHEGQRQARSSGTGRPRTPEPLQRHQAAASERADWAPPYGHGATAADRVRRATFPAAAGMIADVPDGARAARRNSSARETERVGLPPRAYDADVPSHTAPPPVPFPSKRDLYEYIRELATAQAAVRQETDAGALARLRELPKVTRRS